MTCDHKSVIRAAATAAVGTNGDANKIEQQIAGKLGLWKSCPACGAIPKDNQIGLEETPSQFIAALVDVFAEVWRVLRDDGTLWINIGDSYNNAGSSRNGEGIDGKRRGGATGADGALGYKKRDSRHSLGTIKHKDRMLIPHRLAIALQDWGWTVRDEIVWAKRSPMPESVTDRTTKSHEFIFLLTKRPTYFYDAAAVAEPVVKGAAGSRFDHGKTAAHQMDRSQDGEREESQTRNLRSVWMLSTEPTTSNHFASFPSEVPKRCILAGTSEKGCCASCGAPYRRVTDKTKVRRERLNELTKRTGEDGTGNHCANTVAGVSTKTLGWEAGCECNAGIVPCRVCDPFSGTATTGMVATELGRDYTGFELNAEYAADSQRRIESWRHRDLEKKLEPATGQMDLF